MLVDTSIFGYKSMDMATITTPQALSHIRLELDAGLMDATKSISLGSHVRKYPNCADCGSNI